MLGFLFGLQGGFIKFFWDSRADLKHYVEVK